MGIAGDVAAKVLIQIKTHTSISPDANGVVRAKLNIKVEHHIFGHYMLLVARKRPIEK
jgi:hypothetical protein